MRLKIFEPIIKDIISLLEEQISMAEGQITAIILVGGFGQSEYLKDRIQEAIKRGIHVLRPPDGWSAVVKGAVIHGLNLHRPVLSAPRIASRVARRSYGTCLLTKYNMLLHDPKEACVILGILAEA
jgi:serine/threonine-protein kinase ATR